MSDSIFDPLAGPITGIVPLGEGHHPSTTLVDPTLLEVHERERWRARAAQWRARALAEVVFQGEVEARLGGVGRRGPFRGLLHLDVPFRDLADHREREVRFLAVVGRDPLLTQVPFVFVFGVARGFPCPR